MSEIKEEIESEIKRKNFIRAFYLAKENNLSEELLKDLAIKAIWQAGIYSRNIYALKELAEELGYSKEKIKEILMELAKKEEEKGNKKLVSSCYDYRSGKYLSFEEWLEKAMKEWNKIK